jgi:hypothetical protein
VLSLFTCDLGAVFELIGATSAAALAYILPPLCYIKLSTRSWKTFVAMGCVAFGCVVMGLSLIIAVSEMINSKSCLYWRAVVDGDRRGCGQDVFMSVIGLAMSLDMTDIGVWIVSIDIEFIMPLSPKACLRLSLLAIS